MALELEAARVRRNPWITALSFVPWALIPLLVAASVITKDPYAAITPHLAIIGAFAVLMTWRRKPYARWVPARVRVDDKEVRVGDDVISRDQIKSAELLPGVQNPIVRLSLRGRADQDIVVRDQNAAHQLLMALGFDPTQTTASYHVRSPAIVKYRWAPILLVPIMMVLAPFAAAVHAPWLIPLAVLALVLPYMAPAKVTVGVDGVLVRWLWTRAFIQTSNILFVERFEHGFGRSRVQGVKLTLKNGATLELPIGTRWNDEQRAMLQQRIMDVVALASSSVHVEDEARVLARGKMELRDWIGHLKAMGTGATATLRTAPVLPDQLWRVALDPAQPEVARAAAAVALTPTLDEPGRVRLAEVAKATAAPKLRVALERAASEATDEEMEEALRELERE